MYIEWKEEFNLGNRLIDTQHQMLVLLCRKLDIAIKTKRSDSTIQMVMRELQKFVEFHFASEQNLMREIGYPDLSRHTRIHNELLIEMQIELRRIRHHKEFPDDVLYALSEWLTAHMRDEDSKIAAYVRNSTERPIGEDLYVKFMPIIGS